MGGPSPLVTPWAAPVRGALPPFFTRWAVVETAMAWSPCASARGWGRLRFLSVIEERSRREVLIFSQLKLNELEKKRLTGAAFSARSPFHLPLNPTARTNPFPGPATPTARPVPFPSSGAEVPGALGA